ncbi:MAG: signal transduction histidine kinase [Candidatus Krumholzibacteriia bacterium]|jgi:signal transduction histidine kinase
MNLRGQILIGAIVIALLPLALAIKLLGNSTEERFTELDTERVTNQLTLVRDDLTRQSFEVAAALDALAQTMTDDNAFRLAVLSDNPDRDTYLRDFAPRQMSLMNLDLLQIQTSSGRVISSGHFPHSRGTMDPHLPVLLARAPGEQALISARTAEKSFLALARSRQVTLGGTTFHLVGGKLMDAARLRNLDRDGDLAFAIVWPDGFDATSDRLSDHLDQGLDILEVEYRLRRDGIIVRSEHLPLIWDGALDNARLLVIHDRAGLRALISDLKLRLILVLVFAAVLAIVLATFLAGRVSKPLRSLAAQTEDLDLDRLDIEFQSKRKDEVGRLTNLLGAMTARLRTGVAKLRSAEQKATMGEMARQVNHDIRNGITPLRNVMRHLSEVNESEPDQLTVVFGERRETLENGLAYLEDLATHYAKLVPGQAAQPCHLADIIVAVLDDPGTGHKAKLVNAVPANLPVIMADPVSLRRVFGNLVRNGLESLPDGEGSVTVDATVGEDPNLGELRILVSVSDTGEGIAPENLDAIFTDFFTTREQGTGLGLSNVRRLIGDCGGTIKVHSELGRGTTFYLSFPPPETSAL